MLSLVGLAVYFLLRSALRPVARMTERMSNGFLRPGLSVKICPTVVKSVPGPECGLDETSLSTGSLEAAGRGKRSPGAR